MDWGRADATVTQHAMVRAPLSYSTERRKARQRRASRGGAEGIRTPDLLNAIQTRSQLRHSPTVRPHAGERKLTRAARPSATAIGHAAGAREPSPYRRLTALRP